MREASDLRLKSTPLKSCIVSKGPKRDYNSGKKREIIKIFRTRVYARHGIQASDCQDFQVENAKDKMFSRD